MTHCGDLREGRGERKEGEEKGKDGGTLVMCSLLHRPNAMQDTMVLTLSEKMRTGA